MRIEEDKLYARVIRINKNLNKEGYDIRVSAIFNPTDESISWTASHKGKVFSNFKTFDFFEFNTVSDRILDEYNKQNDVEMTKYDEQFYKDKIASLEALLSAYKVILEGKDVQIKLLQEYIKKGIDVL